MKKMTSAGPIAAISFLILLAGCDGLKIDQSSESLRLEGQTAALVNGQAIYTIDVELEAVSQGLIAPGEAFTQDHEQYQIILDQLIDQRLLAQAAVKRELDTEDNARHRLAIARERILGNLLIENLVAREITEDRIQEMYNAQVNLQQLNDEVRISLITLADEAAARTLINDYREGAEFSALAFKYSTDASTRIEGGDLGFIGPTEQPEPFSSVIANTPTGEISDPFRSGESWHVLKVEDRRQRAPKTLEEMRPEIVTFLTYSQLSKTLRQLRIDATIKTIDLPTASFPTILSKIGEEPASETEEAAISAENEPQPAQ